MKPNELLNAIGKVDDAYIEIARSKPKTDKKIWITVASVAACLCIAAVGVFRLSSIKKLTKIELDETLTDPTTTGTSVKQQTKAQTLYLSHRPFRKVQQRKIQQRITHQMKIPLNHLQRLILRAYGMTQESATII